MADRVFHRRNTTAGVVPTTASLLVGELGMNVADGKMFVHKSSSVGESIETALVSNTTTDIGTLLLSGSLILSGSPSVNSGSVFVVSTDNVLFDFDYLYFSGSADIIGSFNASSITGSLLGTSSWAVNASTASFLPAGTYQITSSWAVSSSRATTSSFALGGNGSFSGSFSGSGANLSGIPASGITGLNLSQISSGSVSASISPNNGLEVNTNTIITGSLTVITGSNIELQVSNTGVKIGNLSTDNHQITGSLFITGALENSGSGHVIMYNTSSGLFSFTASSAIGGGGGVTSLGSGSFGATFDGNGGVVTINKTIYVRVPTAISMSNWQIVAQPSSTCTIAVFADTFGNFPPTTPTDDIFTVSPSMSSATSAQNTSPTFTAGYSSTVLPAGSWVGFRTTAVTGSTWINISVNGLKA